jgi:hypothetical protein
LAAAGIDMTARAHIFVLLLAVFTIWFILRLVRRRQLRAKYAILWLTVGVGVLILAAVPNLLNPISSIAGIYYQPATLLLFASVFLLCLDLHFSWELSRLEDRTRTLAEKHALLQEEVATLRRATVPPPGVSADSSEETE